jgi:hypothetical protein
MQNCVFRVEWYAGLRRGAQLLTCTICRLKTDRLRATLNWLFLIAEVFTTGGLVWWIVLIVIIISVIGRATRSFDRLSLTRFHNLRLFMNSTAFRTELRL